MPGVAASAARHRIDRFTTLALPATVVVVACFRLCHLEVLWADEDYHLAAALQILHGKVPYRDFWYDKPPLCAAFYLLIGGWSGWPLRLLDAAYVLVTARLAYLFAKRSWGVVEGWTAALLFAFFTTFYLPSAVVPFAADALMVVPHLAAMYCAMRGATFWAGTWCGIAFLFNVKAVFVLSAAAVWVAPELALLAAGFAVPIAVAAFVGLGTHALGPYYRQVWQWGYVYAAGSPNPNPVSLGIHRVADWAGFHAAIVMGAAFAFRSFGHRERWKFGAWIALSLAAACLGTRFAPHYFWQMLPPVLITAARGITLARERFGRAAVIALAILLLIPAARFGPRYIILATHEILGQQLHWSDLALDLDSKRVARIVNSRKHSGETLFVWGYRPDVYVYTRLISDSRFWDSQALTGVPADRHLRVSSPIYGGPAAENRKEFARSAPTFFVDGLGLMNPGLAPQRYPELQAWLANYSCIGRTGLSIIYQRKY